MGAGVAGRTHMAMGTRWADGDSTTDVMLMSDALVWRALYAYERLAVSTLTTSLHCQVEALASMHTTWPCPWQQRKSLV